ncbi:hypothetical protein [Glutamicibacter arilaitensis]|uniref:hypothetical protein n=1 Tax=Glutamicibacter arilaitensis TaxID=256701 RepID=UPI003A8CDFE5
MKFLWARKFGHEHLRGPSVDALKVGARKFYGEIVGGTAARTPLLVTVKASRWKINRLNSQSSEKLYLPENLDVLVTIRAVNLGSTSLFPEIDTDWDFLTLGPGEENEWLNSHPINWRTLDESAALAESFWDLDTSLG